MTIQRPRDDFRWPNGARVGLVFNVAYEGWSAGQTPGIGPMGNPLKPGMYDANAASWALYGPTRGIWRALEIAARHSVATSVMVNGVLAQDHPDTIRAIRDGGHEIVAHSWGMDVIPVYLDAAGQRANIARTVDAIVAAGGGVPTGWISPRGTGAPEHPRLLAEAGFLHHGDCNDDDLPHRETFAGGASIVGVPLTMDVNDLPSAIRYGNNARAMLQQFEDALVALQRETRAAMLDVTIHTHVYGRPAGAWVFDECMRQARGNDTIWIGTRDQAASAVRQHLA